MKKTKEISMDRLKKLTMNDLDKKVIICIGSELRIAELPEHGTAAIRIADSSFQRMEYSFTIK